MALVLYVLAGVMAAGGLAAVYSGSDIIVMERGWTMVIAGSVVAASGALLAGIATVVARLQGIENEFARLSERLLSEGPERPREPSFADALGMAGENPAGENPAGESRASDERASPAPSLALQDTGEHRDLEIAPEPVLGSPPPETPPPVSPEPAPIRQPQPPAIVTEGAVFAERRPAPEIAAAEVDLDAPAPTIVGTYNSGGNFYIMFSDGSIKAETPAGKFRFDSLDELKTFIAAGGDKAKAAP